MIGERFENGTGAFGLFRQEDRQRFFQCLEPIIPVAIMPIDPVQKRGEIDELVSHIDELEIEEFLFTRHAENVMGDWRKVNR